MTERAVDPRQHDCGTIQAFPTLALPSLKASGPGNQTSTPPPAAFTPVQQLETALTSVTAGTISKL